MAHLNTTGILTGTITSSSTLIGNNVLYSTSGNSIPTLGFNTEITDFFELVLAALGYDITFEDFNKMTKEQQKQLIRDIKLKTII